MHFNKKYIFLVLFVILNIFGNYENVFAQEYKNNTEGNGYITGLPQAAREGVTQQRQREIDELSKKTLFGNLKGKWFDGAFYNVLKFFDNFYLYFMGKVRLIAIICFCLSLGIGCIKLVFGGMEVNKLLVQTFMALMTCLIMITIFPSIMRNILGITINLASGAAFSQPLRNDLELYYRDQSFKNWLVKLAVPDMISQQQILLGDEWVEKNKGKSGRKQLGLMEKENRKKLEKEFKDIGYDINDLDTYDLKLYYAIGERSKELNALSERMVRVQNPDQLNSLFRAGNSDVESVLSMNIVNGTGLISLNQLGRTTFITLKALWGTLSVKREWKNVLQWFGHLLFVIFISLMYLFCACMGIANYMMVLVQFGFLYGLGVLFIPLMLWDATKVMFEKVCGSMMNITVHLLVKSLVLMLIVFINIDILRNCFLMSDIKVDKDNPDKDWMQRLEYYFSAAFLTIFLKLMNDQSTSIADFLCGGSPRLSFGEFAQAAASAGAAGMVAGAAGKAVVGGAAKTALGVGGALAGAGMNMAATKAAGGSFGDVMGAGGANIGNSLINGADNIGGKALSAIRGAPGMARNAAQMMRYGMHPVGALSAEGVGLAPNMPGRGGGGGGGGGGRGGGDSLAGKSESEKQSMRNEYIAQMNSKDAATRARGAMGLGRMDAYDNSRDPNSASGQMKALFSGLKHAKNANNYNSAQGPINGGLNAAAASRLASAMPTSVAVP